MVAHGGRIVKNTGDGFLAEFSSAVEAVRAAVQFQTHIHDLTIGDAEDGRIRSVLASTSATSLSSRMTSLATASILRRGLRASQNPVASVSRLLPTTMSGAKLALSSPI
jgi:class 3 adenylate cyclase